MTQIIAASGAHATGKSVTLDAIAARKVKNFIVDDFKISRTVLAKRGQTLEEATATSELTKSYQTDVLKAAHSQLEFIKFCLAGDPIVIVDRSVADIFAYTRLWCERNNIEKEWLVEFKAKCVKMLSMYDKIFVFPIGVFPFVDDGIRAKHDTQEKIHLYTHEFLYDHFGDKSYPVTTVEIEDRADQIIRIIQL